MTTNKNQQRPLIDQASSILYFLTNLLGFILMLVKWVIDHFDMIVRTACYLLITASVVFMAFAKLIEMGPMLASQLALQLPEFLLELFKIPNQNNELTNIITLLEKNAMLLNTKIESSNAANVAVNNAEIVNLLKIQNTHVLSLTKNIGLLTEQMSTLIDMQKINMEASVKMHNAVISKLNSGIGVSKELNDTMLMTNNVLYQTFDTNTKQILQLIKNNPALSYLQTTNDLLLKLQLTQNELIAYSEANLNATTKGFEATLTASEANKSLINQLEVSNSELRSKVYDFRNQNIENFQNLRKDMEVTIESKKGEIIQETIEEITKPKNVETKVEAKSWWDKFFNK